MTDNTNTAISHEAERLILLVTPCCQRAVTRAYRPYAATEIVKRKCPKCRTRWQVKISPLASQPADGNQWREYHRADWVAL